MTKYLNVMENNRKVASTNKNASEFRDLIFSNFVDFVLHETKSTTPIDGSSIHWWLFTDLCKLCQIKYDFIGRVETLPIDVQDVTGRPPDCKTFQNINARVMKDTNGGHTKYPNKSKAQVLLRAYERNYKGIVRSVC